MTYVPVPRRPMTAGEIAMCEALGICRLLPASFDKRFIAEMAACARDDEPAITERQALMVRPVDAPVPPADPGRRRRARRRAATGAVEHPHPPRSSSCGLAGADAHVRGRAHRSALAAMTTRQTHTFATLGVSAAAYDEIKKRLDGVGYQHAFVDGGAIDMHGIGLVKAHCAVHEDCSGDEWPSCKTAEPEDDHGEAFREREANKLYAEHEARAGRIVVLLAEVLSRNPRPTGSKADRRDYSTMISCADLQALHDIFAAASTPNPALRPVDQTRFGTPHGNCLMACVASLTGVALDTLDAAFPASEQEGEDWWQLLTEALHAYGWHPAYIPGSDGVVPRGYAIGSGVSPRDLRHAVVVKDGSLAHDPHPSRDGSAIDGYYVLIPVQHPS